jgi:hypothetical protein
LRQRTRARAHALVGWLSGRLDSSVRPCGRARGVAGVGVVYQLGLCPCATYVVYLTVLEITFLKCDNYGVLSDTSIILNCSIRCHERFTNE